MPSEAEEQKVISTLKQPGHRYFNAERIGPSMSSGRVIFLPGMSIKYQSQIQTLSL